MRRCALAFLLAGCGGFELQPIELDVSTNCNEVEVLTIVPRIQSPARPWHTIVGAAVDRVGGASGWLLVVRSVDGGLDQLALVHVDEALQVDRDVTIDLAVGLVDQLELVPSAYVGTVFLTQRAPGTFYVWRYDAASLSPLVASSGNLAIIYAPCEVEGVPSSCDASQWFQDLVFFGESPSTPHAFTFPPMSDDESIDVTPTRLNDQLSTYPLDDDRTLDFSPRCDESLPPEDLLACEMALDRLSYPVLESVGLARDLDNGITALALYREVQTEDESITLADLPVLLFRLSDLETPFGILRVNPALPTPRNQPPRGVALDASATYILYTAIDGSPVLVRASHSEELPLLLEGIEIAEGMTLLQLEEDIALHRVVDGTWEILKVFPDAPQNSVLTTHAPEADVEAVVPAGRGMFVVRTADGDADLVQLRCTAATIP